MAIAVPVYSFPLTVPDQTIECRNQSEAESFTHTDITFSEQGSGLEAVLHCGYTTGPSHMLSFGACTLM